MIHKSLLLLLVVVKCAHSSRLNYFAGNGTFGSTDDMVPSPLNNPGALDSYLDIFSSWALSDGNAECSPSNVETAPPSEEELQWAFQGSDPHISISENLLPMFDEDHSNLGQGSTLTSALSQGQQIPTVPPRVRPPPQTGPQGTVQVSASVRDASELKRPLRVRPVQMKQPSVKGCRVHCPICGIPVALSFLIRHAKQFHPNDHVLLSCDGCDRTAKTGSALVRHQQIAGHKGFSGVVKN